MRDPRAIKGEIEAWTPRAAATRANLAAACNATAAYPAERQRIGGLNGEMDAIGQAILDRIAGHEALARDRPGNDVFPRDHGRVTGLDQDYAFPDAVQRDQTSQGTHAAEIARCAVPVLKIAAFAQALRDEKAALIGELTTAAAPPDGPLPKEKAADRAAGRAVGACASRV